MGLFSNRRVAALAFLLPVMLSIAFTPMAFSGPRKWISRVLHRGRHRQVKKTGVRSDMKTAAHSRSSLDQVPASPPPPPLRRIPRTQLSPDLLVSVPACIDALDMAVDADGTQQVLSRLSELAEGPRAVKAVTAPLARWLSESQRGARTPDDILASAFKLTQEMVVRREGDVGRAMRRLLERDAWTVLLGGEPPVVGGGEDAYVAACQLVNAAAESGGVRALKGLLSRRGVGADIGALTEGPRVEYDAEDERIPRGLRNQGNTCYMNCVLQQLQHIPVLRDAVISRAEALAVSANEAVRPGGEAEVLIRLAETFLELGSEKGKGAVNPWGLVQACGKSLGMTEHILAQNDASELLMRLMEHVEEGPGGTDLGGVFRGEQAFANVHEACGHVRSTTTQPFVVLPVPIKGLSSLPESLSAIVHGDEIGEVKCKVCGETSVLRAKQTFTALPEVLVVQLQRFEVAPPTWETVRIPGPYAFPTRIDVRPYMVKKDGTDVERQVEVVADGRGAGGEEPMEVVGEGQGEVEAMAEEGDAMLAVATDTGTSSSVTSIPPAPILTSEWYKLKGVVMHIGRSPNQGHYYSYVRVGNNWYLANDQEVIPVSESEARAAWYTGGNDSPFLVLYEREVVAVEEEEGDGLEDLESVCVGVEGDEAVDLSVGQLGGVGDDDMVQLPFEKAAKAGVYTPVSLPPRLGRRRADALISLTANLTRMAIEPSTSDTQTIDADRHAQAHAFALPYKRVLQSVLPLYRWATHVRAQDDNSSALDANTLDTWTHTLADALVSDAEASEWLLQRCVSEAWLDMYVARCPERGWRRRWALLVVSAIEGVRRGIVDSPGTAGGVCGSKGLEGLIRHVWGPLRGEWEGGADNSMELKSVVLSIARAAPQECLAAAVRVPVKMLTGEPPAAAAAG